MTAFLSRVLSSSRYLIMIAVIGALIGMVTLLVFGMWEIYAVVDKVINTETPEKIGKTVALYIIEAIDIFLLATVCYITALGLFELFISDDVQIPEWLAINTLDDLKNKLTSVVIVVMGVIFLGQVVGWDGKRDLIPLGAPIALIIAALTWFLSKSTKKS
ncbi:MAG: YqhA family protein [Chloroflexota bacterium]|jgi:uncharacterized membrane protein YqhA